LSNYLSFVKVCPAERLYLSQAVILRQIKIMVMNSEAINPRDLITRTQAAELRGVSRAAIGDLIKRGRLHPIDIAGRAFLSRHEVESFEPELGGRPRLALKTSATGQASAKNGTHRRSAGRTGKLNKAFRQATESDGKRDDQQ
jgi:hypothetical protein